MPSYAQVVGNCWIMHTVGLTDAVTERISQPARNAQSIAIDGRWRKESGRLCVGRGQGWCAIIHLQPSDICYERWDKIQHNTLDRANSIEVLEEAIRYRRGIESLDTLPQRKTPAPWKQRHPKKYSEGYMSSDVFIGVNDLKYSLHDIPIEKIGMKKPDRFGICLMSFCRKIGSDWVYLSGLRRFAIRTFGAFWEARPLSRGLVSTTHPCFLCFDTAKLDRPDAAYLRSEKNLQKNIAPVENMRLSTIF